MYMFSKDKPNIDGDGTKTLAVAGWSGWYKSLSPAWYSKPVNAKTTIHNATKKKMYIF